MAPQQSVDSATVSPFLSNGQIVERVRGTLVFLGWLIAGAVLLCLLLPWHIVRRIDVNSGKLEEDVQLFGRTLYAQPGPSDFFERFGRTLSVGCSPEWWTTGWPGVRVQPNFVAAKLEIGLRWFVQACDDGVVPEPLQREWARLVWEAMRKGEPVDVRDEDGRVRLVALADGRVLAELPRPASAK